MSEGESRESERGRGQTEQWRLETRERRRAESREKGGARRSIVIPEGKERYGWRVLDRKRHV